MDHADLIQSLETYLDDLRATYQQKQLVVAYHMHVDLTNTIYIILYVTRPPNPTTLAVPCPVLYFDEVPETLRTVIEDCRVALAAVAA